MSTEKDFNEILRSKFADRELPVDEANWKSMRTMIDEKRRAEKRRALLLYSTIALLCCIGGYFIAGQFINTATAPAVSANKQLNENKAISSTNNSQPSTTQQTTRAEQSIAITTTKNENTTDNNKVAESANKPVVQKQMLTAEVQNIANANHSNVEQKANNNNGTANSTGDVATIKANNSSNQSSQTSDVNRTFNAADTKTLGHQKPNVAGQSDTSVAIPETEMVTTTVPRKTVAPATIDSSKQKTDTASRQDIAQQNNSLPPIEGEHMKKGSLSVEVGAGYSLGWKYGDTVQGRSINPLVGVAYTHKFDSTWSIKAGLQFSLTGGMSTVPFNIKHTTYDFGMNSNDTTVTTKWLYYISIPFQVEYNLGHKNAVGLGGSISYLISGSGTVKVTDVNGNVSGNSSSYSQYMYVKGYNQWNASVFLLYKRNICKNLSAYLIPYYGLMDLKNNTFFNRNSFERDSGIKLILSYSIL